MNAQPGMSLPDIGITKPPTPDQQADARAYIARHEFDDEADILDALGLA